MSRASWGELQEPPVVEQNPDGEDGVQVRLVGVDLPVAAIQLQASEDEDQRLLTGGQGEGSETALVVVQIVEAAVVVEGRGELARTVEEDDLLAEAASLLLREGVGTEDRNLEPGSLQTTQPTGPHHRAGPRIEGEDLVRIPATASGRSYPEAGERAPTPSLHGHRRRATRSYSHSCRLRRFRAGTRRSSSGQKDAIISPRRGAPGQTESESRVGNPARVDLSSRLRSPRRPTTKTEAGPGPVPSRRRTAFSGGPAPQRGRRGR